MQTDWRAGLGYNVITRVSGEGNRLCGFVLRSGGLWGNDKWPYNFLLRSSNTRFTATGSIDTRIQAYKANFRYTHSNIQCMSQMVSTTLVISHTFHLRDSVVITQTTVLQSCKRKCKISLSELKYVLNTEDKGKGRAVPLQAWSGPEGSRKLRFPDFMTTAQDGGKVVSLTHRLPLPPGNTPGTHFC